jgi:hypothetical protein
MVAMPIGSALGGPVVAVSPPLALGAGALLTVGSAAVARWAIPRDGDEVYSGQRQYVRSGGSESSG